MKLKHIQYVVRMKDEEGEWEERIEDYVAEHMTKMEHAKILISLFNQTLQKGETPRTFIKIIE